MISISRYLAFAFGLLTPIAETIRRWHTWRENPPALFDDYILGGLLLYGAWRVTKNAPSGQRYLAAAWGFMCGMAYYSFFDQFNHYRLGMADPAPVSSGWVLTIKGIGFATGIVALIFSLWPLPRNEQT